MNYPDLPVKEIISDVRQTLTSENTLIVSAPPGAGKSTLLPLALMDEPWLTDRKILMLEPRRLAARMIAARMASLVDEEIGNTIGYRIRLETRVSKNTRIEVVTEGILTRMLQSDNSLEGIGLVIFDEFHERSIHADMALAFCREAQHILRPDLRILIMSATLDISGLEQMLSAKTIVGYGRQFQVEIKYTGEADAYLLPEMTARVILNAVNKHEGDTLVFMPGEGEIRKCGEILRKNLSGFAIHPLYGRLPHSHQQAAILPNRNGKRKVVLATSIAETSLTIEGIKIVIDTGFGRTSRFDPKSGLSRLETVLISIDSADQRAGRAGRLSRGVCYRMWTKASHTKRIEHRVPEILEADLTALALELAGWGVKNITDLSWLSPPPSGNLKLAEETLEQIGAIKNGKITSHGKTIHTLACHPRIAHMLLRAKDEGILTLATDLAALLEERDPLSNKEAGIDINLRIEALRRDRRDGLKNKKFGQIEKVAASYRKMFAVALDNSSVNPYETGILLVFAYPERIACARPGNNAQFQLSNGRLAMAHHSDDLAHEPWLSIAHLDSRDGMGKIFLASPLNPRDLAPLVVKQQVIKWETRKGGLQCAVEMRIGNIVLQSTPLLAPDEELVNKAIIDAVKNEGAQLLDFGDEVKQWQNRVMSLRKWNRDAEWPDVSVENLLESAEQWLSPYLKNVKKNEDLKKLELSEILHYHLAIDKQKQIEKLAPQRIKTPSGSYIKLQYQSDGSPPVLAVRLQEVFGMTETPVINQGKTAVIMHLLSPGFKLVQITADLKSFWSEAYFEVKKEMKRRYPKHYWPDNPLEAEAVKGVKRKTT